MRRTAGAHSASETVSKSASKLVTKGLLGSSMPALSALFRVGNEKRRPGLLRVSLGGDYLRLPMSLTIGVVGLRALLGMGRGGSITLD